MSPTEKTLSPKTEPEVFYSALPSPGFGWDIETSASQAESHVDSALYAVSSHSPGTGRGQHR